MKSKIIVLCGGNSAESEVSLSTGKAVYEELCANHIQTELLNLSTFSGWKDFISFLQKEKDAVFFNALHGAEGENGKIQTLFELMNICYTGSDARTSAIAMDKFIACKIAENCGIPVPKSHRIASNNIKNLPKVSFPVVVKPNDSGSSVATYIVKKHDSLMEAVENAAKYSDFVLMDEYIPGRELTVTIIAGEIFPVVEIKPKNGWYDFTSKYTKGQTEYIVPAELTKSETEVLCTYAKTMWDVLNCKGYARVDFRYDGEKFYFLEVNTLPGMTALSLTPMAAKAGGLSFFTLIMIILEAAQKN